METFGLIGAGNMAEAIIRGVTISGLYPREQVLISDVRSDRLEELTDLYGVAACQDNRRLAAQADVLVLSIKPKNMVEVLQGIKGHLRDCTLILSIVAGKRVVDITSLVGDRPIIRVMPNMPGLINQGVSALYPNSKAAGMIGKAQRIFDCVGKTIVVQDEGLIDAVTAVSGSGPAYYFLLMEAMIEAGVELGLSSEHARLLVLQTAKGAALLAEEADQGRETPADLTRKVATPGGTTEAALNVFKDGGFKALVGAALKRACQRSRELSGG